MDTGSNRGKRKTNAEYQAAYYARHPGIAKEINHRAYLKARETINNLKNVPCADCGNRFPPCAMDFDHRDPSQKRFNVSERMRAAAALQEAAKCDVVCANCHRIRTYILRNHMHETKKAMEKK